MQGKPYFSLVIPIYNEQGNITPLHEELVGVLKEMEKSYEIIYVNDGSTDESFDELRKLSDAVIINLNRNYGQATAFDAGFRHAHGRYIITMDGDGQNDPRDIPLLVEKMYEDNLDVVAGYRKNRADKQGVRVLTVIGRMLRHLMIKDTVHDTGCSFRIYTAEAAKSLDIGGEMHRYILALLGWKGFHIGEIVVNDRRRMHGKSKYNYSKAVRGFIDLVYVWFIHKYSQRPLHLFGYLSLYALIFGALSGFWTLYGKIFLNLSLNRNGWALVTFFLLLASIMLFSFGIAIDLLIRILLTTSAHEKRYYVREVIRR